MILRDQASDSTPINTVDRALVLVSGQSMSDLLSCLVAGSLLPWVLIIAYYLERVEGTHSFRLLIALLFTLGWCARALLLRAPAAKLVRQCWPEGVELKAGRTTQATLLSSLFAGVPAAIWLTAFLALVNLYPLGCIGLVLLLPLRGLFAPTWLVHSCFDQGVGYTGWFKSFLDGEGSRLAGVGVELLFIFGLIGLYLNLYVSAVVVVLLVRTMMGIDLFMVESFTSLRNPFMLIFVAGVAVTLMQPVRLAAMALRYTRHRVVATGLDLVQLVNKLPTSRSKLAAVMSISALFLAVASPALAQPGEPLPVEVAGEVTRVETVQRTAEAILAQQEFQEFSNESSVGIAEMLERWLKELMEQAALSRTSGGPVGTLPLPGAWVFVLLAFIVAATFAALLLLQRPKSATSPANPRDSTTAEVAPQRRLDQAARLAQDGRYRDAIRQLYLASLAALDRQGLAEVDAFITNGAVVAQLSDNGPRMQLARDLTHSFDAIFYGNVSAGEATYLRCRDLSERLLGTSQ